MATGAGLLSGTYLDSYIASAWNAYAARTLTVTPLPGSTFYGRTSGSVMTFTDASGARVASFNRHLGVKVHEISPREVAELWPLARTDDVLAGFYIPDDGRVNPVDVTMSLAKGARMRGVAIVEGVAVTGFLRERGTVIGVRTAEGDVQAEDVVNCAGMWARQLGELAGVSIPLQAAEHYYLLTAPIAEVDSSWPVLEDPASYGYYREEGGGLMLGMFEPVCAPLLGLSS